MEKAVSALQTPNGSTSTGLLNLHEQCRQAHVAFFVKQLGSQPHVNGILLNLKVIHAIELGMPEYPAVHVEKRIRQERAKQLAMLRHEPVNAFRR